MAELISLWNSNGMECDAVAMLLVEVVMCWGFMVLVFLCWPSNVLKFWLCLWRVLWEGCCDGCVVLLGVVLVIWFLSFVCCISVGVHCWWVWEALEVEVDEGWCVVFVKVLWVGRDGMWYGRWAVVLGVSKGEGEDEAELCLNGWWLSHGVDLYVLRCMMGVWLV